MSYLAVDRTGDEYIYSDYPINDGNEYYGGLGSAIKLPIGSVKKLTGLDITFDDGPVELDV